MLYSARNLGCKNKNGKIGIKLTFSHNYVKLMICHMIRKLRKLRKLRVSRGCTTFVCTTSGSRDIADFVNQPLVTIVYP